MLKEFNCRRCRFESPIFRHFISLQARSHGGQVSLVLHPRLSSGLDSVWVRLTLPTVGEQYCKGKWKISKHETYQ